MTHHDETYEGPLRFRPTSDLATRRVMLDSLTGNASASNWLPEGLTPELDALRAEHLRVRGRVVDEDRAVEALEARHRREDADHEEALRQSHRDGQPSVKDERTPPDQREAEHAQALERYWSAVHVLGECADAVVAYLRHAGLDLLSGLRSRREPLAEKRREAQRLQRDAEIAEWGLAQLGQWVQAQMDGVFGAQPAPVPTAPPATFNSQMLDQALERPFHRQPEAEALPKSWQETAEAEDVDPLSPEDETGEVSELVENEGASA